MELAALFFPIFVVFVFMSFKLFNSLRSMTIYMGIFLTLSKFDNPLLFWIVIALQCLMIGVLLAIMYVPIFVLPNRM